MKRAVATLATLVVLVAGVPAAGTVTTQDYPRFLCQLFPFLCVR